MTTITANSTIGIYLTSPAYVNPIVIDSGVIITGNTTASGNGIYANSGTWTITNAGDVAEAGTNAAGIHLAAGGVVFNQVSGTIGSPAADASAIYILGGAGTVTNAGTINGGVWLETGGTVTNQTGGRISSSDTSGGYGVGLYAGGMLTNAGQISGILVGIDASHLGGTVTNQAGGTIIGQYAGVLMGVVDKPIAGGRYLINQTGGTISGDSGFIAGGSSATVINSGAITGTFAATITQSGTTTLVVGAGVSMSAGGTVTNQSGGNITGASDGVDISNFAGTVVNYGSIGGTPGTKDSGVRLAAGGSVTNQSGGGITGYNGIYAVYGSGTTNTTVVNSGSIGGNAALGDGVYLGIGGAVTNQSVGSISGYHGVSGQFMTVVNYGSIAGNPTFNVGAGVDLHAGGAVTNQSGGSISGRFGVTSDYNAPAVTVVNVGDISGNTAASSYFGVGVVLGSGGLVTNQISSTIAGFIGIYGQKLAPIYPSTVVNSGTILGNTTSLSVTSIIQGTTFTVKGSGVDLQAGGSVTNQSGGMITGYRGIVAGNIAFPSTVINAGTISGIGTAVAIGAGGFSRVVVDPGAVFVGTVDGGNTIGAASGVSTLELATGASSGTLSGLGTKYIDFAHVTIDGGAKWQWAGMNTLAAGATITNAGSLTLSGATLTDGGALINNGAIVLDPSTLTAAGLTGTGSVTIDAGSTLEAQGTIASGETVMFAGSGAYLHLDKPGSVAGSVTNFDVGETIDLKGINPASVSYSGGVLNFTGGSFALSLASAGAVVASASTDGAAVSVLCFCADTLILTPTGERRVQELTIGDPVTTHSGETRRITWIGVGQVLATRGRRDAATPVIVRKGALADNVPNRDLHVTKGHSLFLNDVLIPVEELVNHRSIEWDDRAQEVKLYHIALETHDVLIANGAPAESYRDDGNRWLFQNADSAWDQPPLPPCAPILTGGPVVDAIWRRLLDRTGPRRGVPLTDDPNLHLLIDGKRIDAIDQRDDRHVFRLRTRPRTVRIRSLAAVPQELGLARDPRSLGVAIRRIVLAEPRRRWAVDADAASLADGYHAFEPGNRIRWTDGDAAVPAELFASMDGPCMLTLHLGGATQYLDDGESVRVA